MYNFDVKSTFGNERAEQSTGTTGPVFTAARTRVRMWSVRTCAMRLAGLSTSWSQELPSERHPAGGHQSYQWLVTWRRCKGWPISTGVRRGACGPVQRCCERHHEPRQAQQTAHGHCCRKWSHVGTERRVERGEYLR